MPPAPAPHRSMRLVHRVEHGRMLAHAEIVVRAPDRDFASRAAVADDGLPSGNAPDLPLEIGEDPIAALLGANRRAGCGRKRRSS